MNVVNSESNEFLDQGLGESIIETVFKLWTMNGGCRPCGEAKLKQFVMAVVL